MAKVTLDAETFKALASATRLTVLRALDERRKTLTELAKDLDLNKATVHEHLQLLMAADLVKKRDDEGRKWIYYELTWRGQKILHPQETTTFNVLLGMGVAAAGGGTWILLQALKQANEKMVAAREAGGEEMFALRTNSTAPTSDTYTGYVNAEGDQVEPPQGAQPASEPEHKDSGGASDPEGSQPGAGTEPTPEPAASEPVPPEPAYAPGGAPAGELPPEADPRQVGATPDAGGAGLAPETASWLDEGGWVAVALFALVLLFGLLAFLVRRKLRGGRPDPRALEEDARQRASVSQRP